MNKLLQQLREHGLIVQVFKNEATIHLATSTPDAPRSYININLLTGAWEHHALPVLNEPLTETWMYVPNQKGNGSESLRKYLGIQESQPAKPQDGDALQASGNSPPSMLNVALANLSRGFRVFPLPPGKKSPSRIKNFPNDAFTCEKRVRDWWGNPSHASDNVAIACGTLLDGSAFFALDVDKKHSVDGSEAIARLEAQNSPLPRTYTVCTPTGGGHRYFKGVAPKNSVGKLGRGLDIRADGGYVVAAGSVLNKDAQGEYIIVQDSQMVEAPKWLLDELERVSGNKLVVVDSSTPKPLESEIPEGERNVTLTSIAGTLRRKGADADTIYAAITAINTEKCSPPLPDAELRAIANSVARYPVAESDGTKSTKTEPEWPEPQPLNIALPPVMPFDLDFLPESLRAFVADTAERMQVPLDFPGVMVVVGAAGVVNRRAFVQPRQFDDSWKEALNLWGAIIGESGMKKSPTLKRVTSVHIEIESEWAADYDRKKELYEREQRIREAHEKELKNKKGQQDISFDDRIAKDEPKEPVRRRLIVTDATPESLHRIMSENPEGVFERRDELSGWLDQMEAQGREAERGLYLTAWGGDEYYTSDRIGRGSTSAVMSLSLFGSFQPELLQEFLANHRQDGLFQRFQLMVYPDVGKYPQIDRAPDYKAFDTVKRMFKLLAALKENSITLGFSEEAQLIFNAWEVEHQRTIEAESYSPKRSHLGKYRGLMPVLAGLFQLVDLAASLPEGSGIPRARVEIDAEHVRQAIRFIDYLKSHLGRIYNPVLNARDLSTIALSKKILAGELTDRFTARDVQQKGWGELKDGGDVNAALEELTELGWLRTVEKRTGGRGRPTWIWLINPKLKRISQ